MDADELAIKTLEAHLIKGVTAICGDVEALTPKEPYDAMVFCLFGRTQDTLRIARKQCRGKIFLVKSDYSHHRFSAGKVSLGEYTPVLAAVKPKDTPFLRAVRGHENAELVFIDEQNRDALLEKLLPHILRWNEA